MYLLIRPLKPLIIPNKKRAEAPNSKNGASNGINFEPGVNYIVKFAHLCLHDEETIEAVDGLMSEDEQAKFVITYTFNMEDLSLILLENSWLMLDIWEKLTETTLGAVFKES